MLTHLFRAKDKRDDARREYERAIWKAGFEYGREFERASQLRKPVITGDSLIDRQIQRILESQNETR